MNDELAILARVLGRSEKLAGMDALVRVTARAMIGFSAAVAKRPVLGKAAYIARVRRVFVDKWAQICDPNCAKSLRNVCREAVEKRGAASIG